MSFAILVTLHLDVLSQDKISFEIYSNHIGAHYTVDIIYPNDYDSLKQFPILYCLDWLAYKDLLSTTQGILSFSNHTESIILVGIAPADGWESYFPDRTRDFTPTHLSSKDSNNPGTSLKSGVTGGGDKFLSFLKHELITRVEIDNELNISNRGLFGYSYGGLFTIYALIEDPNLFQKYLIGSPSLWFDDFTLLSRLKNLNEGHFKYSKKIFLSVGENEIGDQLASFGYAREYFNSVKNINFLATIIEDEGHSSAISSTIVKGLKFLYYK